MAGEEHRGAGRGGVGDELVDEVATGSVEAGVGLVEQPEFGTAGDEGGECGPTALSGRETGRWHLGEPTVEPARRERPVDVGGVGSRSPRPEADVVGGAEIGVEAVVVGEHAHPPAYRTGCGSDVDTEDVSFALHHPHEAGAGAQERRLPGAVGAAQQHDLTTSDREVDAGESGEPVEEHDCRLQHDRRRRDGGRHMERPNATDDLSGPPRARTLPRVRLAKLLGGFGRLLIWAGAIILLFVAYQLWGTNLAEAQAQDDLESEFEDKLIEAPDPTPSTTPEDGDEGEDDDPTLEVPPELLEAPEQGEPIARIEIPEIGVDKIVVEGVSRGDLQKGPGHYPETPLPGQEGNAAIAGHRTTYGAPFHRVDELEVDDEIIVTTVQGRFTYTVTGQEIVSPSDIEVIDDKDDDRLTLTSCHPKYSARQRIIISAALADDPAPPTPRPTRDVAQAVESIDGEDETGPLAPVILFGLLALAIWLFFFVLSRKWRRWPSYALGVVPFGVSLFVWFGAVAELLPANF